VVLPSLVAAEPEAGVSPSELADRITADVEGVEALDQDTAVAESPGVAAVNQSFQIILALAFVVIALVVGFFFLILTVQKTRSLVLLRAVGSPTGYLVRALMVQIVVVFVAAALVALILFSVARAVDVTGDVGLSLPAGPTAVTIAVLGALALLAGAASLRRVFRIEPVRATQPGRI
jgi:putative ABC transport system permease protein